MQGLLSYCFKHMWLQPWCIIQWRLLWMYQLQSIISKRSVCKLCSILQYLENILILYFNHLKQCKKLNKPLKHIGRCMERTMNVILVYGYKNSSNLRFSKKISRSLAEHMVFYKFKILVGWNIHVNVSWTQYMVYAFERIHV